MKAGTDIVYLDHNATTPLLPAVQRRVAWALEELWGNPSSPHPVGLAARRALDEARDLLRRSLEAASWNVVFTSGATEANRLALWSAYFARRDGRRRIIVSAVEHSSVREAAQGLRSFGAEVLLCPVDRAGVVKRERLRELCTGDTALVAVMAANNEIGTLQPLPEVVAEAHRCGALVLCDAVQAVGKVPFSCSQLGCDYVTVSGHKIYGPKGVGALLARPRAPLRAILRSSDQEGGVRPGTENVPAIVGLGEACRAVPELLSEAGRLATLRDRLERGLQEACGAAVVGAQAPRLPTTTGVIIQGIEGKALMVRLSRRGVMVGTASACHSRSGEPSHVVRALGISAHRAVGFLRLSVGVFTKAEEIDRAVSTIAREAAALRSLTDR